MKRISRVALAGGLAAAMALTLHTTIAAGRAQGPAAVAGSQPQATAEREEPDVTASATGAGHYLLQSTLVVQFAFHAIQRADGTAHGMFRQRTADAGGTIDFEAEVTCLAVDPAMGRAWIGGVITSNESTEPAFADPIYQPGHDVWFRVLDSDPVHEQQNVSLRAPDDDQDGDAAPDRSTFLGFEGAIPSSAAYCQARIWPDGNARTWPVTHGHISVR